MNHNHLHVTLQYMMKMKQQNLFATLINFLMASSSIALVTGERGKQLRIPKSPSSGARKYTYQGMVIW